MPLFYSISEGISLGIISYVVLNVATGKAKKVSPLMYVLAVLFVPGLSLIPLFPSSFVLPYSIDSIGIYAMGAGNVLTCVVSGTLPLVDRQVSILVQTQATAESETKLTLYIGEYFADATPRIMFKCDNYEEFNSLTRCVICSNDDADSNTDALYSGDVPLLPVQQETHTFDTTSINVLHRSSMP